VRRATTAKKQSAGPPLGIGNQYHLIRPLTSRGGQGLFIYLALSKTRANLAMARLQLRRAEEELQI
jgi:hypothetical protein